LYRDINLKREIGEKNMEYLREIKNLFDPNLLLNPQIDLKRHGIIKKIKKSDKVKNYLFNKLRI
jgi:hypothetical protein